MQPNNLPSVATIAVTLDVSGHLIGSGVNLFANNTGLAVAALGSFFGSVVSGGSGVSIANAVYTTGNQIILGNKTFDNSHFFIVDNSIASGTLVMIFAPESGSFYFQDANNNASVDVYQRALSNSNSLTTLDWEGSQLLHGAGITLDWFNRILSGNWTANVLSATGKISASGFRVLTTADASGYVTTGQTGAFGGGVTPTGNLTGAFYPLNSNPSNFTANSPVSISVSQSGTNLNTLILGTNLIPNGAVYNDNAENGFGIYPLSGLVSGQWYYYRVLDTANQQGGVFDLSLFNLFGNTADESGYGADGIFQYQPAAGFVPWVLENSNTSTGHVKDQIFLIPSDYAGSFQGTFNSYSTSQQGGKNSLLVTDSSGNLILWPSKTGGLNTGVNDWQGNIILEGLQSIGWLVNGRNPTNYEPLYNSWGANMFYNYGHSTSPELQVSSQGSISFTCGLNSLHNSWLQLGGAGPYFETINFESNGPATSSTTVVHGKICNYFHQYWLNSSNGYGVSGNNDGTITAVATSDGNGYSQFVMGTPDTRGMSFVLNGALNVVNAYPSYSGVGQQENFIYVKNTSNGSTLSLLNETTGAQAFTDIGFYDSASKLRFAIGVASEAGDLREGGTERNTFPYNDPFFECYLGENPIFYVGANRIYGGAVTGTSQYQMDFVWYNQNVQSSDSNRTRANEIFRVNQQYSRAELGILYSPPTNSQNGLFIETSGSAAGSTTNILNWTTGANNYSDINFLNSTAALRFAIGVASETGRHSFPYNDPYFECYVGQNNIFYVGAGAVYGGAVTGGSNTMDLVWYNTSANSDANRNSTNELFRVYQTKQVVSGYALQVGTTIAATGQISASGFRVLTTQDSLSSVPTGQLTGAFYPLLTNPSGFLTVNTVGSKFLIPSGTGIVNVTGLSLTAIPFGIVGSVSMPTISGLNLWPTFVANTFSTSGFSASLNGNTDTTGYLLSYIILG